MNTLYKIFALSSLALALSACDVDKTEQGALPKVEADGGNLPEYEVTKTKEGKMPSVDVDGGKLPAYDVDTADVDVDTKKVEVTVPDVDVTLPDEQDEDEPK